MADGIDVDELRKAPQTWREYLGELKTTTKVFRWVWTELSTPQSRYWIRRAVVAFSLVAIFQASQARLVSYVYNGLNEHNLRELEIGLIGFAICLVAQKTTEYFQFKAREWLLGLNWAQLDKRITELFFEKSLGQHIQEGASLSVANIDKGRWRLLDLQGLLLFEGIPVILGLSLTYILLWTLSPVAGLIMTGMFATYLVWMLFLNVRVVQVCTPIDKDLRRLNRHRLERWENIERVKVCAKEAEELTHMSAWFDRAIGEDRAFWLWFSRQATARQLVTVVGLFSIMCYGSWLVWSGAWSIGLLYPLFRWSQQVVDNMWQIGYIEHMVNWYIPSVNSMIEALSVPPAFTPNSQARPFTGQAAVSFDDVSYVYPLSQEERAKSGKGSAVVLSHLTFSIKEGEKVALIGESGAGKTTAMHLALRFMDPTAGKISVGGEDLRELDLSSWLKAVGYIPQRSQVLDGTLRYNLVYGLPQQRAEEFDDESLWSLTRLLKGDFNGRLIQGLETMVGQRGIKLSGGQAQRVMIIAAAAKLPRFMVIDEATSSLDSSTERAVHDGLKEVLQSGVGALVVAHRLSTVRDLCDRFIVLKNVHTLKPGEPQVEAEADSFEKLYQVSPTFRQLADDQHIVI